jgi:hypothetical protein
LGDNQPATLAGDLTPRMIAPHRAAGTRILVDQYGKTGAAGANGMMTRIYRATNFTGSVLTSATTAGHPYRAQTGDLLMIVQNAAVTGSSTWTMDDGSFFSQATMKVIGSDSVSTYIYTPLFNSGLSSFSDSNWICFSEISSVGLRVPSTTDQFNALQLSNVVNNCNTIKAWGNFLFANIGSGAFVSAPQSPSSGQDDYGIASSTDTPPGYAISGSSVVVTFTTPVSAGYVVNINAFDATPKPWIPCITTQLTTGFSVQFFASQSVPLNTAAPFGPIVCEFQVVAKQINAIT